MLLLFLVSTGCASGSDPALPDISVTETTVQTTEWAAKASHQLWMYVNVFIDPRSGDFELIPVRSTEGHFNVLNWLENGPCTDCLKITSISNSGYGTHYVDIELTHPFDNPDFTGFDVRGIVMFASCCEFPQSGLKYSSQCTDEGGLANADGYTTLYHSATAFHGFEGYQHGKFATIPVPDAELNGYKRFLSDDPANTRNAFYAGDTVTVTYEMALPDGPFIMGYAVDACWTPPLTVPVTDPMTDFGIDANCPEAWQLSITVEEVAEGLTDCGGEEIITVDVYDWQGKDDVQPVEIECPGIVNGWIEAEWVEDGDGFTRYEAVITHGNFVTPGFYDCLIRKMAAENNPLQKWWLDLSAYGIITLEVVEYTNHTPTAVAEADQYSVYIGDLVTFDGSGSFDTDCNGQEIIEWNWDWDNDGLNDQEGVEAQHSWSEEGSYFVQMEVTDDEGSTDLLDEPLEIVVNINLSLPVVSAGFDPDPEIVDVGVHFFDQGSYDPLGGTIILYEWDWDNDGIFDEEGQQACHSWDIPGMFEVQFRVTTDSGWSNTLAKPLLVNIVEQDGLIGFMDHVPPEINITPRDICISGTYAYVAGDINGLHIFDLSDPVNPAWIKKINLSGNSQAVTVHDGYAYVATRDGGLVIVDVQPIESAHIAKIVNTSLLAHDVVVSGDYAYVATSTLAMWPPPDIGELVIVDIIPPESAEIVKTFSTGSGTLKRIDFDSGYVYAGGDGALRVIHVEPVELTELVTTISMTTANIVVEDGYAYVLKGNAGMAIVDITPPETAAIVHNVPLGDYSFGLVLDGDTAYAAGRPQTLYKIDISSPEEAYVTGEIPIDGDYQNLAYVAGYVYVTNYDAGICVVDVDPFESAFIANWVYSTGYAQSITSDGNTAYVSNGRGPIQVISNPTSGTMEISAALHSEPYGSWYLTALAVKDGYLYAVNYGSLLVFDVDPPELINLVHTVDSLSAVLDAQIIIRDEFLYLNAYNELVIIDITDPDSAYVVNSVETDNGYGIDGFAIGDGYAYVSSTDLNIIDIDPPGSASVIHTVDTDWMAHGVAVSGCRAYVSVYESFKIIDITDPSTADIYYSWPYSGNTGYTSEYSNGFVLTAGYNKMDIIDITDPIPVLAGTISFPPYFESMTVVNDHAYIAYRYGIKIVNLW